MLIGLLILILLTLLILLQGKGIYLLGWSKDGTVEITSDEPLLLTLNGILLEVEI